MLKKWIVLLGVVLVTGVSYAEEGRWSLSTEKKSGKEVAILQTWSKRVMKVLPLDQVRTYSPVPNETIVDPKRRKQALRRGYKFTRLTAKNSSATPIDGGRLLVLQEQSIVMPPQMDVQAGRSPHAKEGDTQEPEDNSLLVTLFDETGKVLWSRRYGPLAGRLPTNREAWALSGSTDAPPGDKELPDPSK